MADQPEADVSLRDILAYVAGNIEDHANRLDAVVSDEPEFDFDDPAEWLPPEVSIARLRDAARLIGSLSRQWDSVIGEAGIEKLRGMLVAYKQPQESRPTAVYRGEGLIAIDGQLPIRLTDGGPQAVVQALIELRAANKDQLVRQSGYDDAVNLLKAVVKSNPQLAPYIRLPGGKGKGGYATSIVRAGE